MINSSFRGITSCSLVHDTIKREGLRNKKFAVDGENPVIQFLPSFPNFQSLNPCALVAQSVERVLGKDEVGGSNPLEGSSLGGRPIPRP